MKSSSFLTGLCVLTALAQGLSTLAQPRPTASGSALYSAFQHPPASARPRVWWHWMNGNISKSGIRQDLLWMHRSGIGGFQNFDAGLDTPPVIANRLTYMTPGWQEAFRYTTQLADSLKLEMAIAGSPGWSESGGPWVKPEAGMKKYVWSETRLSGGATGIRLPKPPTTTGTFQNLPMQAGLGEHIDQKASPTFYSDVAVVAYKLPDANKTLAELGAVVTASSGQFTIQQLTDGDLVTASLLPSDTTKGFAWIQFGFAQPQTIRAVTLVGGGDRGPFGLFGELKDTRSVEVSDDGKTYKWVCYLPAGSVLQQTIAIPATTARYFRITFKNPPTPPDLAAMFGIPGMPPPKAPLGTDVAELALSPVGRVHRLEEKAAFAPADDLMASPTPDAPTDIMPDAVVDLTSRMRADGSLDWTVPPGNWTIVRLGYSLLGITNHPASPEATGLEVDKLNPTAIRAYFTQYLDQYRRATGGLMGGKGGLQYMVTDSWEAGAQNWTQTMPQEFQQRRGYSLLPWIPVLTGTVVKSSDASDRFLQDFRKTLAEMLAEYHYDGLTNLLNEYGMKRYSESHEDRRAMIADGMDVKRTAAVPMSAMWMPRFPGDDRTAYIADIRESASVAHIYGQNLVAAESFTANGVGGKAFSYAPEHIKPTADLELANGLNRFVIHTSVHQPDDRKIPGIGLGSVGQWFTRHETWAGQAHVWTDYLARSSHMLQQGRAVADVVYYYGEDNNITALFGKKLPDVPAGYNYDFINPHALINLLSVRDGKLVTPSGMSYRVLHLDSNARQMSLPVLRKIALLVRNGAVISGVKPQKSIGRANEEPEFARLVAEVWESANPRVHTSKTTGDALRALAVQPDFAYKSEPETQLLYVHRALTDGELYWVNNRSDAFKTVDATFRVTGKKPEIWHPETGRTEAASYKIANGLTTVSLNLTPNDAVFVLFRAPATTPTLTLPAVTESEVATLDGPWQVAFQPDRGAPAKATFDKLRSWTENKDKGIAFFSGTATYTQPVRVSADNLTNRKPVWLDLGDVKNLAEVVVNGKSVGVVWKKPFRIDVSSALKTGENTIDIRVTNLWVNRLIGDAQPGTTNRITFTTMPFYKPDSPLLPSGLLGPVRLIRID